MYTHTPFSFFYQTMQSSNKETSKAAVIQNFLPILDELREMQTENPDTVYAGLAGAMGSALKELGVEEFSSQAGDVVNPQKVAVLEEEYSADVPKGNIVRPVSMGFDLAGNVMRLGQVVVSLGAEEEEQAAAATPQEEESSDDAAVAE
jgi:molecular chaperone GrpE (heat shock protein)